MTKESDAILTSAEKGREQIAEMNKKLLKVARPSSVFSEPVSTDGRTVITASEVSAGMGAGFGIGSGKCAPPGGHEAEEEAGEKGAGAGGGGGGGGMSNSRPVAVISIEEDGVYVEPVIDATKIAITAVTAIGSMALMMIKLFRTSK